MARRKNSEPPEATATAPSEAWQAAERDVDSDLSAGNFETFDSMDDFLKDLK